MKISAPIYITLFWILLSVQLAGGKIVCNKLHLHFNFFYNLSEIDIKNEYKNASNDWVNKYLNDLEETLGNEKTTWRFIQKYWRFAFCKKTLLHPQTSPANSMFLWFEDTFCFGPGGLLGVYHDAFLVVPALLLPWLPFSSHRCHPGVLWSGQVGSAQVFHHATSSLGVFRGISRWVELCYYTTTVAYLFLRNHSGLWGVTAHPDLQQTTSTFSTGFLVFAAFSVDYICVTSYQFYCPVSNSSRRVFQRPQPAQSRVISYHGKRHALQVPKELLHRTDHRQALVFYCSIFSFWCWQGYAEVSNQVLCISRYIVLSQDPPKLV